MKVEFRRQQMRRVVEGFTNGIGIGPSADEWTDSELAVVAGAALAILRRRREAAIVDHSDEVPHYQNHQAYGGLTDRLEAVLSFSMSVASGFVNPAPRFDVERDKLYAMEFVLGNGSFVPRPLAQAVQP